MVWRARLKAVMRQQQQKKQQQQPQCWRAGSERTQWGEWMTCLVLTGDPLVMRTGGA